MKKRILPLIFSFIIIAIVNIIICNSCIKHETKQQNYDEIAEAIAQDYAWRLDSIYFYSSKLEDSIATLNADKAYYQYVIDSLEEEVFLANYKLERIAEYNRIAAQGNNITFLRGWINRVLND